ncbi:B12-binding domain-containing radical SAM protein [Gracilinema caldarium]|uniref:Radical SAM domain protein n=1 Tax=Gracilinema caldarium (strain ATCC 51460 / DSM 7334 / H1) TaxID=744872 RepID=F8EY03_GRAC1|nr:radical SAM protein [Gracilinema caldarium]AEJ20664.1 Radical SAM domain protein [Gracilinema caldarium DSM 7334]
MILLIQPPFVQLNAPYPSLYYLRSFLQQQGYTVQVDDHSIALFHRIFSRPGLEQIFADGEARLNKGPILPPQAEVIARRYLSQRELWLSHIDRLIAFLQGKDREYAHLLALCNNTLPMGPRAEALLSAQDYAILPDQASILASAMLADLADFIIALLDPTFSLVKYADSLAASIRDFSRVASALDGYILTTFYQPFLEATWARFSHAPDLIGLTIPFPGCLAGALTAARSAKAHFGPQIPIVAGGGYVTTELRHIRARTFFEYIDFLSFDRGYGALQSILDFLKHHKYCRQDSSLSQASISENTTPPAGGADTEPILHHCIYRTRSGDLSGSADLHLSPYDELDRQATTQVFPDYRGVDFSRYILPVDDTNPMHRLWTEGRWLKAYLAHGCYWHACAFCDVQLDYIRGFESIPVDPLFQHLVKQSRYTGIRGIHLVDEAAPVQSLIELALLNREAGLPLTFWGNIRFEKAFTPDVAALLASGGLLGVSGGIEVASEAGFKRLGKGIGLEDVVASCTAFKEAGILTHAYLIFGYWDQDEQEIIDAAETLRQLFAAGLIDSAFWHKFVLTRHSRIYREFTQGRHKELTIIDEPSQNPEDFFADNDLRFTGEDRYDRYTQPLDMLLAEWMQGTTDRPVREAFPFPMPPPRLPKNRVQNLLHSYLSRKESAWQAVPSETGEPPAAQLTACQPTTTQTEALQGTQPSAQSHTPLKHDASLQAAVGLYKKASSDDSRVLFLGSRPWLGNKNGTWFISWYWNHSEWTIKITSYQPVPSQGYPANKARNTPHANKGSSQQNPDHASEGELVMQLCRGENPEITAQKLEALINDLRQGRGWEGHKAYKTVGELVSGKTALQFWPFLRKGGLVVMRTQKV